jgi:hypothetical protein
MRPIKTICLVNIAQGDTSAVNFQFETKNQDGAWQLNLMWTGSQWIGWATLPSGEVRLFGCIPGVINWTGYTDFGLVWVSPLAAFGQPDIFNSALLLLDWGP